MVGGWFVRVEGEEGGVAADSFSPMKVHTLDILYTHAYYTST